MYAIVNIAGQQFKVEKDQKVFVNRLAQKPDEEVNFEDVLLIDDDGKVQVGTPKVKNASVTAKILEHVKADKIKVFKKKRRKGYQKLNGHRQPLTQVLIQEINTSATSSKESKKETKTEESES